MHLVINHVSQFEHVDHTYRGRLVKTFTGTPVVEIGGAVAGYAGFFSQTVDLILAGTVKYRCRELHSQLLAGPSQYALIYLTEVHPGGYTKRVENDIHRGSVSQERHILLPYYFGYDTLVSVPAGHLVTNPDLALLGKIDLGKPYDTCGQLITDGDVIPLSLVNTVNLLELDNIVVKQLLDAVVLLLVSSPFIGIDIQVIDLLQLLEGELGSLGYYVNVEIILHTLRGLAVDKDEELIHEPCLKVVRGPVEVSVYFVNEGFLYGLRLTVFNSPGEELLVDDNALE